MKIYVVLGYYLQESGHKLIKAFKEKEKAEDLQKLLGDCHTPYALSIEEVEFE